MTATVLVTGGSGFVASWCIAELLQRGYSVRATVRSEGKAAGVRAVAGPDSHGRLSFAVADLMSDAGWDEALSGCDYVLHVASPLGADEAADGLIAPARDGTLRVLRAAAKAGVQRVVLTSSTAACTPTGSEAAKVADETVWTDPDSPEINAYRRSKTLAERAAWDFMAGYDGSMTLTTVLPGAVFGPILTSAVPGSVEIIQRLLSGRPPGIPHLGFSIVDVRDLADLHLRAMTAPEAAGERFVAAGEFMWMDEMARTLRSQLGEQAARVPARRIPSFAVRGLALFVPALRTLTPLLGRELAFSSAKAQKILGFVPRPAAVTITDCAMSLRIT